MRYALVERWAHCRGCDKELEPKVDFAVKFYSIRNRGQHILICKDCVVKMNELVQDE